MLRCLLTAACLLCWTASAEVTLGLSAAAGPGVAQGGAHVSYRSDWRGGGAWRGTLGLEAWAPTTLTPWVRADVTYLRALSGRRYAGLGVGSGVLLSGEGTAGGVPLFVYSPLLGANVHGVYGVHVSGVNVEGLLRLGGLSSVGVRVDVPLR